MKFGWKGQTFSQNCTTLVWILIENNNFRGKKKEEEPKQNRINL